MKEVKKELKISDISKVSEGMRKQVENFQKIANKPIFRPTTADAPFEERKGFEGWLCRKALKYLRAKDPYTKRFMRIHHSTKAKLLHPILRWFQKRMKGYVINALDDIPAESHNNHIRMFYYSWMKGLDSLWVKFVHPIRSRSPKFLKRFPTPEVFLDHIKNQRGKFQDFESHARRKLILDLWMTEINEDTADREWLNMFMLTLYHTMHEYYNGKVPQPGEQPMYTSGGPFNPQYFMAWSKIPVWNPKKKNELDEV